MNNIIDFIVKGIVLILVSIRFHYSCPVIFCVLKSIVSLTTLLSALQIPFTALHS